MNKLLLCALFIAVSTQANAQQGSSDDLAALYAKQLMAGPPVAQSEARALRNLNLERSQVKRIQVQAPVKLERCTGYKIDVFVQLYNDETILRTDVGYGGLCYY